MTDPIRRLVGGDARTFRVAVVIAIVAMLVRIIFWFVTHRVWEDALITVLHSENFGRGLGLTHFRVGEPPIQGFTSPISVLVPLLADAFHPGWGLILIKLVSVFAAGLSVLLLFGINRVYEGLRLPLPLIAAVAGFVAIEHHQILWGMAGMETQLVVAILLAAFYVIKASNSPYAQGAALAACMYARPDYGFLVLILAAVLVVRAWRSRSWGPLVRAGLTSAAIYGVWIAFTTAYYGSPIPNTILAKGGGYEIWMHRTHGVGEFIGLNLWTLIVGIFGEQSPSFGGHGTGYISLFDHGNAIGFIPSVIALQLAIVGMAVAVARRQFDMAPIFAFLLLYTLYYLYLVPSIFGWYTVPLNAVMVLLAAKGLRDLLLRARPAADLDRSKALWAGALLYLGVFAAMLPITFQTERQIQQLIETPVRQQIGLYLRAKHQPLATVAGEPLGYVGYYSGMTYYDYPGLDSRRVVDFLRVHPGVGLEGVMKAFRPDYLVLRKKEYDTMLSQAGSEWLSGSYVLDRRFTVPESDKRKILFIERNDDTDFLLMRKRETPVSAPALSAA